MGRKRHTPEQIIRKLREGLASDSARQALHLRLAWFLSTSPDAGVRNGPEAVKLAAPAARRTDDPRILDVFAAALAESGRFQEAAAVAAHAAKLATATGQPQLAQQLRERVASYQAGRPAREGG